MRRFLVDVNVILDAILARPRHSAAATRLWDAVDSKRVEALLAAHGMTTLFYLLARAKGAAAARSTVAGLIGVFRVAPVDEAVIRRAVALDWRDFEDAVCAAAAEAAGCDGIVTHDPSGFSGCSLPVLSADTAVALIEGTPPDRVGEGAKPSRHASRRRPLRGGRLAT
jgi:predicted nucleic acid-binding protein